MPPSADVAMLVREPDAIEVLVFVFPLVQRPLAFDGEDNLPVEVD